VKLNEDLLHSFFLYALKTFSIYTIVFTGTNKVEYCPTQIVIMDNAKQDTGKFRQNTKDQYYTKSSVAKECVDQILNLIPESSSWQWIEPSAGNGAFLKALPESILRFGIDLEPKMDGIVRGDFLSWEPLSQIKKIFFGNPPFGKQGSLAKAFIQHASKKASVIAFILPRSFMKPSMSRAFPSKFHCIFQKELEKGSFEVNGEAYDVPCVFQIWQRRESDRALIEVAKESGFQYVKGTEQYHLALRRVGVNAGKSYSGKGKYSFQSHYFLKLDNLYVAHLEKIIDSLNNHIFPSNTVGPRSLSKGEVNEVLNEILRTSIHD